MHIFVRGIHSHIITNDLCFDYVFQYLLYIKAFVQNYRFYTLACKLVSAFRDRHVTKTCTSQTSCF